MIREYAKVADPWALTWANWVDLARRVVPKMIRLRQGVKLTPTEQATEDAELKTLEVEEEPG
jgi:hypothetical protein